MAEVLYLTNHKAFNSIVFCNDSVSDNVNVQGQKITKNNHPVVQCVIGYGDLMVERRIHAAAN
eukprot:1155625-Pelagomonas_calceolata.AAC.3